MTARPAARRFPFVTDWPRGAVPPQGVGTGIDVLVVLVLRATRWLKQPGDKVEAGEPLVEVSTHKVDIESPAETSGDLREIRVQAGTAVPVGAPSQ